MAKDILRKVRLIFDKRSGQQMERDAKKSLSGVERGLGMLKKAALGLAASFGAAFAIRKIKEFGAELVKVASEADAIWNRLSHAVESVGVSFEEVRPDINAFARAMQDATVVGDEQFAEILTELITTSGDYARSINNVGLVADLAAAKQMDLRTAAQMVGRAMVGETGTFSRYGIVIKEGEDAMEVLRRTFGGFAMNEAKSLQGQIFQLTNEWGDFKQALGEVILAAGDAKGIITGLADVVQGLTNWLNDNKEVLSDVAKGLFSGLIPALEALLVVYAKLTRVAAIAGNVQLRVLEITGGATDRIREWTQDLNDYADALDNLLHEIDEVQRRRREGIQLPPPRVEPVGPPPTGKDTGTGEGGDEGVDKAAELQRLWTEYGNVMASAQAHEQSLERQRQGWEALNGPMEMTVENARRLEEQLGRVEDAAGYSQRELEIVAQAGMAAGAVLSGIFAGNIGEMARWKAEQNAIMAAEHFAMAAASSLIPYLGPAEAAKHVATAKMFLGISAAWAALAGATGGFSSSGAMGGPRNTGGAASERTETPGSEVHIYLQGDFDALNPKVQRVVAGAVRYSNETYGPNATTYLHRKSKGG